MRLPKFSLLLMIFLFLSTCSQDRKNFIVYNMDTEPRDSLYIFVGNKTYLIEDIEPRQEKGINIAKLGGEKIKIQADFEVPMPLGTALMSHQSDGTIKVILEKNRILSSTTN